MNLLAPMMRKRLAYQHEHEVRALLWRNLDPTRTYSPIAVGLAQGIKPEAFPKDLPEVLTIPWDISATVDRIIVSPYAELWYYEVVRNVLDKFSSCPSSEIAVVRGEPLY